MATLDREIDRLYRLPLADLWLRGCADDADQAPVLVVNSAERFA